MVLAQIKVHYILHGGDADGFVSHYGFIEEKNIGFILLSSKGGKWFWDMEQDVMAKLLEF